MTWIETPSYIKTVINKWNDQIHIPIRIAGFDLDDTLIKRPDRTENTWELLDPNIPQILRSLIQKQYLIIIFTNQGGMTRNKNFDIGKWKAAMDKFITNLISKINKKTYYVGIYVAKAYDINRKPNLGMWHLMKADLKNAFALKQIPISTKSFYCGDAAGRLSADYFKKKSVKSTKGDFSDTDRKFALNIGIKLLTPEELFLHLPAVPYKLSGTDPAIVIKKINETDYQFRPRSKELIIIVGPPGSGKTEFVTKYILAHGYVHVNQDSCKTKTKCVAQTRAALAKGQNVVVDNTNPDVNSRMTYTLLAVGYKYHHIRCIVLNTDIALAKHLNNVRHLYSRGTTPKISDIVYNIYQKNYVRPSASENFDKIEFVNFPFDREKLLDPVWKKYFMMRSE